jgi:hypothetical protein
MLLDPTPFTLKEEAGENCAAVGVLSTASASDHLPFSPSRLPDSHHRFSLVIVHASHLTPLAPPT